ncbi:MAG TPA: hypothetical protein VIH93_15775 [Thermoanaerobaculia bacterium]
MRFDTLFPALLALASAGFLLLGLRGLLGRRPLVFRSRLMLVVIVLCLLPGSVAPFLALPSGARNGPVPDAFLLLPLVVDVAVLALVLYVLRGYVILGADDRALATALKEALDRLDLPFQESLGRLRLTGLDADLKLLQQGQVGSAQLRMEPEDRGTLDRVAGALRDALAAGPGRFRGLVFAVFTGVGVVMLFLAGVVGRLR